MVANTKIALPWKGRVVALGDRVGLTHHTLYSKYIQPRGGFTMSWSSFHEEEPPSLAIVALRAARRLARRGYNALMSQWVRAGVKEARVPHR